MLGRCRCISFLANPPEAEERWKLAQPAAAVEPVSPDQQTPETCKKKSRVAAGKIVLSDDPRKEQLSQIARDYHDATVRIIRMWLQEDTSKPRMELVTG